MDFGVKSKIEFWKELMLEAIEATLWFDRLRRFY